jgi:Tol biopolymer transport system component
MMIRKGGFLMKKFQNSAVLVALTAAALLILSASVLHSQSAQDLYQKALSQEKAQGNLDQAIAIYKRVIAGAGADRALAAKAQYHIGLCYEKLGTTEAEKAFRQVIDKYPEQKESVTAANERLAVITKAQSTAQNTGIALRQVSLPADGKISPDGKFIALIDWTNENAGDLVLYEVATGKKKALTNMGAGKSKSSYSEVSPTVSWSADGAQIAFSTWDRDSDERDLCTIDRDGSNLKVISKTKGIDAEKVIGWSPDKTAFVISIRNQDGVTTIGDFSLRPGIYREIKKLGNSSRQALSPDGRFVAYMVLQPSLAGERALADIRTIARDGTLDRYIVQHPADDTLIGWTPDNRYILFESDRSGVLSVWAQATENGKPVGNPTCILERSISPLGFARDGSLYFTELEKKSEVYLAQVDLATGKTVKPPESIDPSFTGNKYAPIWSRDGGRLAYFITKDQNPSLRIQNMADGKYTEIMVDLTTIASSASPVPRWDEENFICVRGSRKVDGKLRGGIFRVDVRTGHGELTGSGTGYWGSFPEIEGYTVVLKDNGPRKSLEEYQYSLFRKELKTGEETLVVAGKIGQLISGVHVSPDGKWIGYHFTDYKDPQRLNAFYIVPAAGGKVQQLAPSAERSGMIGPFFFWGPDASVLFDRRFYEGGGEVVTRRELWYMPTFDSKQARRLELSDPNLSSLTFHPDGKTIAFSSQVNGTKVWVMENYLPAKK